MAIFTGPSSTISLPILPLVIVTTIPSEQSSPCPRRPQLSLCSLEGDSNRALLVEGMRPCLADDPVLEFQLFERAIGFFATVDLELLTAVETAAAKGSGVGRLNYDLLLAEVEPGRLCPEYCYGRVSRLLRRKLARKGQQLPFAMLARLEGMLREGLEKHEKRMQLLLETPFQRLLVHAVAQYYGLCSRSEEAYGESQSEMGRRVTTVQLPRRHCGRLPALPLSQYLQQRWRQ